MTDYAEALSRVLYLDLSRRTHWTEEEPDLFRECLGGSAAGIRLLGRECPTGADPLGPENPIVLSVGVLSGLYPLVSKTVAMFKSPLTKNLGESHAGGRCGVSLRMAGYGAVVIKGRSESPVYLVIEEERVKIRDASALWGMNSSSAVGRIVRENEPGAGVRAIMRIGKAGEKLIPYACVTTETYRHFGRLGLGAVFGSKRLKAIMISGKKSFRFRSPKTYRETYDELFRSFTKSALMKKYHDLGTPMNVMPLNMTGTIPTKNMQMAKFEGAEALSGENLAEKFLGRRAACSHCPVSCIHIAALREPYEAEPYFYKTKMISYDYEPIFSLGSMLDIRSPEGFLKLMDEVEESGLDAMSAGVVLSWATEALERGVVTTSDTGGLDLKWGDHKSYIEAVDRIVHRSNDFYGALAEGVAYASSKYGGAEFAMAFGGNEMAGYHTGPAAYVGYLTGARHSHLDGAGYSIDQKMAKEKRRFAPEEVAKQLFEEESWRQVLSSLVACFFARGVFTPDVVARCLNTVGLEAPPDDLKRLGERTLREKYSFKFREGFKFDSGQLLIPRRIFGVQTPLGMITEEEVREGIRCFDGLVR